MAGEGAHAAEDVDYKRFQGVVRLVEESLRLRRALLMEVLQLAGLPLSNAILS